MTDKQKIKKLKEALRETKEFWMDLPCGYEVDPDENNHSPDDAIAWSAGLAVKRINEILKETE